MKRKILTSNILVFILIKFTVVMVLISCGCGGDTGVTRPLPSEYRVLAKNLSQETKTSPNEYRDNKELAEIVAEGQASILDLRGIKSSDTDISYIASQGEAAFSEAVRRIEKLNMLPKPPSLGSVLVESFLHGLYGNLLAGYAIGSDADNKQAAINAEVLGLVAAVEKADAAHILLARVAEKYAVPAFTNDGRIVADVQEMWGGSSSHDWLNFHNSGTEIKDCTILVEMTGQQGKVRKNVHFLPKWASNSWIYCRYDGGKQVLDRVVGSRTVPDIDKVDVSIFSPKFSTKFTYTYSGPEKERHVQEFCNKTKFSGRYRPFAAGVIWDDQRAAYFKLDDGIGWLPKCQVDVTFKKGLQLKNWIWNFDQWNKGQEMLFETPKGGLTFDPDTVVLLVTFPNTKARIEQTMNVR